MIELEDTVINRQKSLVIVAEGKDDTANPSFLWGDTYENTRLDRSGWLNELLPCKSYGGVIVFTDPDYNGGERIPQDHYARGAQAKHAF